MLRRSARSNGTQSSKEVTADSTHPPPAPATTPLTPRATKTQSKKAPVRQLATPSKAAATKTTKTRVGGSLERTKPTNASPAKRRGKGRAQQPPAGLYPEDTEEEVRRQLIAIDAEEIHDQEALNAALSGVPEGLAPSRVEVGEDDAVHDFSNGLPVVEEEDEEPEPSDLLATLSLSEVDEVAQELATVGGLGDSDVEDTRPQFEASKTLPSARTATARKNNLVAGVGGSAESYARAKKLPRVQATARLKKNPSAPSLHLQHTVRAPSQDPIPFAFQPHYTGRPVVMTSHGLVPAPTHVPGAPPLAVEPTLVLPAPGAAKTRKPTTRRPRVKVQKSSPGAGPTTGPVAASKSAGNSFPPALSAPKPLAASDWPGYKEHIVPSLNSLLFTSRRVFHGMRVNDEDFQAKVRAIYASQAITPAREATLASEDVLATLVLSAYDTVNTKRSKITMACIEAVGMHFAQEQYHDEDEPSLIAQHAIWAIGYDGFAWFADPTPIKLAGKRGVAPNYIEATGVYESPLIIQIASKFLPHANGANYGTAISPTNPPIGLYTLIVLGLRRAFEAFANKTDLDVTDKQQRKTYIGSFTQERCWNDAQVCVASLTGLSANRWGSILASLNLPDSNTDESWEREANARSPADLAECMNNFYIPASPAKRRI
ncbi:hypothetical protein BKA70DRAFT_1437663 [Coprinopsis sp. MPI-PUGE-AT-0042]|nr:hypothetical protein BKA70DRAFT_1437663 [Coprinopsis sp. MPI-PUGE-AT-0042]